MSCLKSHWQQGNDFCPLLFFFFLKLFCILADISDQMAAP